MNFLNSSPGSSVHREDTDLEIRFRLAGTDFQWAIYNSCRTSSFTSSLYKSMAIVACSFSVAASLLFSSAQCQSLGEPLSGTSQLELQGDIASELVNRADRFLLKQTSQSVSVRERRWGKEAAEAENIESFLEVKRQLLGQRIGMVDKRVSPTAIRIESILQETSNEMELVGSSDAYQIYNASWPVFEGVDARGLIVIPSTVPRLFCCVLIPDAGQEPEQLCGYGPASSQIALDLASRGGVVVIPTILSRTREARNKRTMMSDQEFIYRSAFVLGRHPLGYMVNESMAAIDCLKMVFKNLPIIVAGWGEGGWIAFYTGALDTRVETTLVSGHFGPRENLWNEPIHRNVQGLLNDFGDAEIATLFSNRNLLIESSTGPQFEINGPNEAPGELKGPSLSDTRWEYERAIRISQSLGCKPNLYWHEASGDPIASNSISVKAVESILKLQRVPVPGSSTAVGVPNDSNLYQKSDSEKRRKETVAKWDRFQQRILESAAMERTALWDAFKGIGPSDYERAIQPFREQFREEIIGDWHQPLRDINPKSRLVYDRPDYFGYEVTLDVFDDLFSYGILLVPRNLKVGEKRQCVVFQHGLEGRPQDTMEGMHPAYNDVSVQLVKQGYVVFAPQNLYLFKDRFRTLQRKSNPLGKTLFSIIVPQHQQIVNWLGSRAEIDSSKIAFYGLSYGGKSAMRIPALVQGYCLSICSADFNDWVWKNASTTSPYSYVWTYEYEIFEFGLGRSFNYAEMASLIAPRPFMVERGHQDGVAPDERVAYEFAKVKRLYSTILKNPDVCQIEYFDGPHTINGKGTFDFLSKHLMSTK